MVVRGDVNLTALKVSAEIGQSLSQSLPGLLFIRRFGSDLETEFVICQPCFEVGHQNIEQVFFGLVKVAGVCTPGYITDNINTRNSPIISHFSYPIGQAVAGFIRRIAHCPIANDSTLLSGHTFNPSILPLSVEKSGYGAGTIISTVGVTDR